MLLGMCAELSQLGNAALPRWRGRGSTALHSWRDVRGNKNPDRETVGLRSLVAYSRDECRFLTVPPVGKREGLVRRETASSFFGVRSWRIIFGGRSLRCGPPIMQFAVTPVSPPTSAGKLTDRR